MGQKIVDLSLPLVCIEVSFWLLLIVFFKSLEGNAFSILANCSPSSKSKVRFPFPWKKIFFLRQIPTGVPGIRSFSVLTD